MSNLLDTFFGSGNVSKAEFRTFIADLRGVLQTLARDIKANETTIQEQGTDLQGHIQFNYAELQRLDAGLGELDTRVSELSTDLMVQPQKMIRPGQSLDIALEQCSHQIMSEVSLVVPELVRQEMQAYFQQPPPPQSRVSENIISPHGIAQAPQANGYKSDSDSDMSEVTGDTITGRKLTYWQIRELRGTFPGMKVSDFCQKYGINEQSYYRAMRQK